MKLDRIVRYKALCDMPHFTKGVRMPLTLVRG